MGMPRICDNVLTNIVQLDRYSWKDNSLRAQPMIHKDMPGSICCHGSRDGIVQKCVYRLFRGKKNALGINCLLLSIGLCQYKLKSFFMNIFNSLYIWLKELSQNNIFLLIQTFRQALYQETQCIELETIQAPNERGIICFCQKGCTCTKDLHWFLPSIK